VAGGLPDPSDLRVQVERQVMLARVVLVPLVTSCLHPVGERLADDAVEQVDDELARQPGLLLLQRQVLDQVSIVFPLGDDTFHREIIIQRDIQVLEVLHLHI